MTTTVMYFNDKFAAIAADTLVSGTSGDGAEYTSKTYAAPHARIVMGFTGLVCASESLLLSVNRLARQGDIDDLADDGVRLAFEVIEATETAWQVQGFDPALLMSDRERVGEGYLFGWSRRSGAVVGYLLELDKPDDGMRPLPAGRLLSVPGAGHSGGMAGAVSIPRDFVSCFQATYGNQDDGRFRGGPDGTHIGGDMLLTLLSEREIRTRHIGAFANRTDGSAWAELAAEIQKAAA